LIEAQGFRILRFWDNQVFLETQAILQEIMRVLEVARRANVQS
jgi:very-short-patch-repair endonuclease